MYKSEKHAENDDGGKHVPLVNCTLTLSSKQDHFSLERFGEKPFVLQGKNKEETVRWAHAIQSAIEVRVEQTLSLPFSSIVHCRQRANHRVANLVKVIDWRKVRGTSDYVRLRVDPKQARGRQEGIGTLCL